jgi:hypothetical protein
LRASPVARRDPIEDAVTLGQPGADKPRRPPPPPDPASFRRRGRPIMPRPKGLPPIPTASPRPSARVVVAGPAGGTAPIRVGPFPAPMTAIPPQVTERKFPADFVSSAMLPTVPSVDSLRVPGRSPRARRWLPWAAAVVALLGITGAGTVALRSRAVEATGLAAADPVSTAERPATTKIPDDPRATTTTPTGVPSTDAAAATRETEPASLVTAPLGQATVESTAIATATDRQAAPGVEPDARRSPPTPNDDATTPDAAPVTPPDANADASAPTHNELDEAVLALDGGRLELAYALASDAFTVRPSRAALVVMVRSSCAQGKLSRARAAYTRLPLSIRPEVRAECLDRGVELGA